MLRFRQRDKEQLVKTANILAIIGTVFLASALTGAVFVVTDLIFKNTMTAVATGATAALLVSLWYGLPGLSALRDPD